MKEGQPLVGRTWMSNTFPNTYPNSELRSKPVELNFYMEFINGSWTLTGWLPFFALTSMRI